MYNNLTDHVTGNLGDLGYRVIETQVIPGNITFKTTKKTEPDVSDSTSNIANIIEVIIDLAMYYYPGNLIGYGSHTQCIGNTSITTFTINLTT